MNIKNFLLNHYPGQGQKTQKLRQALENACHKFIESGLADEKFKIELCSGSEPKFWSCISEALLALHLWNKGFNPKPSIGGGPDFLVIENDRKTWIEVICPEAKGIPSEWTNIELKLGEVSAAFDFPHEQILLRWTSAIKEKAEKLLGSCDGKQKGYVEKGIVAPEDSYVIAINGRQLRNGPFPALLGISNLPFAVEAVFPIGPYQVKFDRETLEQTGEGHQHRPQIFNRNNAPIPTHCFLHERFRSISAIWATDLDGTSCIGNSEPMAVIHNPYASIPIPVGFLPAHNEYVAKPIDSEMLELNRLDGCLSFLTA